MKSGMIIGVALYKKGTIDQDTCNLGQNNCCNSSFSYHL